MNIKRDKTYQARMDGLKYALEIVERGGIEELKKEIRVRNAHFHWKYRPKRRMR